MITLQKPTILTEYFKKYLHFFKYSYTKPFQNFFQVSFSPADPNFYPKIFTIIVLELRLFNFWTVISKLAFRTVFKVRL